MFRPVPEATLFRAVPLRLIASVLIILAFAFTVLLLFSLEHGQVIVQSLTEGKAMPTPLAEILERSRMGLIAIALLVFVVSGIATAAVMTVLHYDSTRRRLEEVKGLARRILESIPTGVLTVDARGLITAVNPAAEGVLKRSTIDMLGDT